MTDPFAVLGVPRRFSLDLAALEQRHRDLSRALHPDRHVQGSPAERRLSIEKAAAVNDAYRALRSPQTRAAALLATAGRTVAEQTRADPALLLEVMELRETLDAVRHAPDRDARVASLRATVESRVAAEERVIAQAFDALPAGRDPAAGELDRAYAALVKLRYFYRFVEEAEAMVDDAEASA